MVAAEQVQAVAFGRERVAAVESAQQVAEWAVRILTARTASAERQVESRVVLVTVVVEPAAQWSGATRVVLLPLAAQGGAAERAEVLRARVYPAA